MFETNSNWKQKIKTYTCIPYDNIKEYLKGIRQFFSISDRIPILERDCNNQYYYNYNEERIEDSQCSNLDIAFVEKEEESAKEQSIESSLESIKNIETIKILDQPGLNGILMFDKISAKQSNLREQHSNDAKAIYSKLGSISSLNTVKKETVEYSMHDRENSRETRKRKSVKECSNVSLENIKDTSFLKRNI